MLEKFEIIKEDIQYFKEKLENSENSTIEIWKVIEFLENLESNVKIELSK